MQLKQGQTIDRYEVQGILGRGGMAVVYLVSHRQLGSQHAMKVLSLTSESVAARLLAEGRAQSSLRHPNVVSVTDVVETRGLPALVMEFIDGPALDRLLKPGALSIHQADFIARGVLAGMSAAHRHGLIHRDLKPGNILIAVHDRHVVPKVTDFGLAKMVSAGASEAEGHTRTGATMGTPAYMAPEQIRDAKNVDARADVFALGAVLYELVTGRRAFEGADAFELLTNVTAGRFVPVRLAAPQAPERMLAAIEGAMVVDPSERWASVDELLAAWTAGTPQLSAAPDEPWYHELVDRIQRAAPADRLLEQASQAAGGSSDTFALDQTADPSLPASRSTLNVPPPSSALSASEPPHATGSSSESVDLANQHPAFIAAGAAIAAIPLVMGMLAMLFQDLSTVMDLGGPFMLLLLPLSAVACGTAVGLSVHERAGNSRSAAWWALPVLTLLVGSVATLLGLRMVGIALVGTHGAQQAMLATLGARVAMTTNLTGLTLGTLALVISCGGLAWAHRPSGEVGLTRRSLAMLAVGLSTGTALVVANPWLSSVTDGAAPFTTLLTLMGVLAASALLGGTDSPRVLHARWLLSGLGLLAVVACAEATEAHGQYHLFLTFNELDLVDGLPGAIAFVDAMTSPAWPAVLAWALAGTLSLGVGLWHTWPPFLLRQAVVPAVSVALFLGSQAVTAEKQAAIAGLVVPSYLAGATQWHLGFELSDTPRGLEVINTPPGAALHDGDILVAINRTRVRDVRDVLERLRDCRCDKGSCSLSDQCLTVGTPLQVELAQGADGQLATRQTPWLGGTLAPERQPPPRAAPSPSPAKPQ